MNSIKLHFLGLNGIFLWLSNYTRWCKDFQNYPTEKRYHILEKSKWSDSICYNLDMRPPFGYWLKFFKHVQQGLETHFLGSRKKLVRSKSWNFWNCLDNYYFLHQKLSQKLISFNCSNSISLKIVLVKTHFCDFNLIKPSKQKLW